MVCSQEGVTEGRKLNPKIEMFSPFEKPFDVENGQKQDSMIVSPKVLGYMIDDTTKIVAKCTPCQCCACR